MSQASDSRLGSYSQHRHALDLAHLDACVQHDLASAAIARHAAGMSWGLYFAFYNRAKDRYQRWTGQSKLAPQVHLLSAAEAGCVVSP